MKGELNRIQSPGVSHANLSRFHLTGHLNVIS